MAYTGLVLVCTECSFYSLYRHYSLAFGLQDGLLGAVRKFVCMCVKLLFTGVVWEKTCVW